MPICEEIRTDGSKAYRYATPDDSVLYNRLCALAESLEAYISSIHDLRFPDDVVLDPKAIGEIIVRVDKRRDYFLVFHDQTEMNEIKEAALYAYWILKFRPISVSNPKYNNINDTFALFMIFSMVKRKRRLVGKKDFPLSKDYVNKLSYAFAYWDLSKEALIVLAETLCETLTK